MKLLHVLCVLAVMVNCAFDNASTSDETLSGVSAKVLFENGNPVPDATVSLFPVNDTTRIAMEQVETDANGYFAMSEVDEGMYNILTKKDTLVALVDSIVIRNNRQLDNIVIKPQSTLSGFVSVEPNHTPLIVTVQVLGTYLFTNVDSEGAFTLSGLAEGKYTLCFQAMDDDYVPTYFPVDIAAGTETTLPDTVKMTYAGIPVVTEIFATYDTLTGTVLLNWNQVQYHNLDDYLIYRKNRTTESWVESFRASTSDTFYTDGVDFSECVLFNDTDESCSFDLSYRVIARSKTDEAGEPYAVTTVHVVSPGLLVPAAVAGSDTVVPAGESVLLQGSNSISLPDAIKEYAWDIGNTGVFTPVVSGDTTVNVSSAYDDTLVCVLRVTGIDNSASFDTIRVVSGSFTLAAAEAAFSPRTGFGCITFNDTLWIVAGQSINNGGANNEIWFSPDGASWEQLPPSPRFASRYNHTTVVFHDSVWVIGGYNSGVQLNDVWCSGNMRDWEQVTSAASFCGREGHSSVVFNDKIWVIGGWAFGHATSGNEFLNDVWYSENGIEWTAATDSGAFSGRYSHASVVFDDKIWIIGGKGLLIEPKNDIWYSSDGSTWVCGGSVGSHGWWHGRAVVFKEKIWFTGETMMGQSVPVAVMSSGDGFIWEATIGKPPFSKRGGHGQVVYHNKMWIIGGSDNVTCYNDVWYLE